MNVKIQHPEIVGLAAGAVLGLILGLVTVFFIEPEELAVGIIFLFGLIGVLLAANECGSAWMILGYNYYLGLLIVGILVAIVPYWLFKHLPAVGVICSALFCAVGGFIVALTFEDK